MSVLGSSSLPWGDVTACSSGRCEKYLRLIGYVYPELTAG